MTEMNVEDFLKEAECIMNKIRKQGMSNLLQKTLLLSLFFLTLSPASLCYPLDLRDLNGVNWLNWSFDRRIGLVQGALMEGFTLSSRGYEDGIISDINRFLSYRLEFEVPDVDIMEEITLFYINTGRLDYPIYVVLHIRNIWRFRSNLPEWKYFSGWR